MAQNRRRRKRFTFQQQAVLPYMEQGETYAAAKERLDKAWAEGKHPEQRRQERAQD